MHASRAMLAAVLMAASIAPVFAQEQEPASLSALLALNAEQLNVLYAASPRGEIPDGFGRGKAIAAPGTILTPPIAFIAGLWRGKVFNAAKGTLHNKGPFGMKIAKAKVYVGESWFDSKPSIIIDYQETSTTFGWIRDEIRLVAPGLYLGRAYNRPNRSQLLFFALDFNEKTEEPEPSVQLQDPWNQHSRFNP